MRYFSNSDLVKLARKKIEGKTQREWAKQNGVSVAYLNGFLKGRWTAGPLILKALGFTPQSFHKRVEK